MTNLDTPTITTRHYYTGAPSIRGATFVLDFQPPVHCSLLPSPSCQAGQTLLSLGGSGGGGDLVSFPNITTSWGGWLDQPAGVAGYILSIYHLEENQGVLLEGAEVISTRYNESGDGVYEDRLELAVEGPYSFVLQTLDGAGNLRYSRRLLLFDNSSSLNIEPSSPLTVISAVPEALYLWQNSTSDPIVVSGRGHFYNSHLRANAWLAPVGNSFNVSVDYDHPLATGDFPRRGTPNALGVVSLSYDFTVDQVVGQSAPPDRFRFESADIALAEVSLSIDLRDGDSVRVWFLARDYNSRQINDSVLVHVDSSGPILRGLGLVRNGVSGISLHGTESLADLEIEFDVLDEHSGVLSVAWSIGTGPGMADVGSGEVAVQRVATCSLPECVCDIVGQCSLVHHSFSPPRQDLAASALANHDAEYHITITATNHARISVQQTLLFTVDVTPPLAGVVFDGPVSGADVDYKSEDLLLEGWWAGFFDRESDILFYQYVFAAECANGSAFVHPLLGGSDVVMETSMQSATAQAQGENATSYSSMPLIP